MSAIRKGLDALYLVSGVLSALCLIAILSLIVLQMLARWTGEVFPGAPEYASYAMAAASFLAFANALGRGAHIRVSILLNAVPGKLKYVMELWCFGLGGVISAYFTYHAYQFVYFSWRFKDISQGQDATLLWIPQSVMVIGGGLLTICFVDNLVHLILRGEHRVVRDTIESHAE
ncbi:TRAP transporter small permease [Cognatishimia sp. F0-27]|uniref:TRAP transporter small permease n=1 Tax=Cognatishimia sp. F0-27 TaxID=2816855 RepID=UPI001D0C2708|nr:TRAP transporter small permease [Cognatishimia sp. F0-27]MCC1495074.1 TRAP transporter small permease [Cognatishimia sp. F0-27]